MSPGWRIIAAHDRDPIRAVASEIVKLGRSVPGYFMSTGNQIPWNLTPVGIKMYFEASEELPRCDV